MNLHYIEQHDIARRYLQGKLSTADTALFEEFMLDKPELITQLELDAILLTNLSKSADKTPSSTTAGSVAQSLQDVWKLGLAAALGALMVLPFVQHDEVTQQLEGRNHIAYLESNRSVNTDIKSIVIAPDAQQLILMIQPATLSESHFAVTLQQRGDESASTYRTHSQLANSGDLVITIPAELLNQGIYELNLSGLNSTFTQTFSFELAHTKS